MIEFGFQRKQEKGKGFLLLNFCFVLFSCGSQTSEDTSSCDLTQVEFDSERVAWSQKENASLVLNSPSCGKDKKYQILLTQDANKIMLDSQPTSDGKQGFTWFSSSLQNFHLGLVEATIFVESVSTKTQFLFLYQPDPFAKSSSLTFSIGKITNLFGSYTNHGPLSLGFGKKANMNSPVSLLAFSKEFSTQALFQYLYTPNKIEVASQTMMSGPLYNLYPAPAMMEITTAQNQDPVFFVAIPNPMDEKKNYLIYRLPENATSLSSYSPIVSHISSLTTHPLMTIDSTGTMVSIGDSQGNLESYRFINNMVFPIPVEQFIPNAVFIKTGAFFGAAKKEVLDIVVLDQSGSLFVLPYQEQTQNFGKPILLTKTASTFQPITAMAVGDVDQDTLPDIILASGQIVNSYRLLNVFINQGRDPQNSLRWSIKLADSPLYVNSEIQTILVADMNQDGKNDLVLTNFSTAVDPVNPNTTLQLISP